MDNGRKPFMPAIFLITVLLAAVATPAQEQSPPPDPEMVVPAGTILPIILNTFLNTQSSQPGDTFYADTTYPIWIQQRLVIPRGSIVKGVVTEVVRPGRIRGKGRLAIRFESILLPNGVERDLIADLHGIHAPGAEKIDRATETVEGGGSTGRDAGQVVGTAGQGAIIGAIAGRGQGAAIGAGSGAAVGLATVLLSRGRDLVLGPGTAFDIELAQPLRFAYGELFFSQGELDRARREPPARQRYNQEPGRRPGFYPPGRRMFFPRRLPWPGR